MLPVRSKNSPCRFYIFIKYKTLLHSRETSLLVFSITRNVNEKCLAPARLRDRPDPQKPPFLACQKVAPPPCKKPPFLHFPRRKACNFDRIVHENAPF